MGTPNFVRMAVVALIVLSTHRANCQSVIVVSNSGNRTLHLIDEATGVIQQTVGVHAEVNGLAADDGEQTFYYTDGDRLFSVPYNGGVSTAIGLFTGTSGEIFGLAFHEPSSTLYGCNHSGIYEISTTNAATSLFFDPPGANELNGIAVDKWTNRFFVNDDNGEDLDGPGVYELNLNTMAYFSVVSPYPNALTSVDGLAAHKGNVYLVQSGDLAGDQIYEVEIGGGFIVRSFETPFGESGDQAGGTYATVDSINMPVSGVPVPLLAEFDTTMINYMRRRDIGAGVLAVSRDGVVIYRRAFGWRDAERELSLPSYTLMRLASCTKPVTAAAIQDLASKGKISLSDKVFNDGSNGGILTYTPFGTADPDIYQINVRDLLQHEGGWDSGVTGDYTYMESEIANDLGVASPPGRDATVRWIMGKDLVWPPGFTYRYSNVGYMLLGLIVEEVSGVPHLTYVRENIFEPLDVNGNQIQAARTFEMNHDAREPWYNHNGYTSPNVFYPAYHPDSVVFDPYGGWDMESRIGQGGMVASPVALLKMMDNYIVAGNNIGGSPPSGSWTHFGAFDGTNTVVSQRGDGVNFVVLFNKRATYSDSHASEITALMNETINRVTVWPEQDVTFSSIVRFVIPNGEYAFGDVDDIGESDDRDIAVRRSNTDVSARVTIEVTANSRVGDPDIFQFRLESSVFARTPVLQYIDIFNYRTDDWEEVDRRVASRFVDRIANVEPPGDFISYVNPSSGEVRARVRYISDSPRQRFSANIDQMIFSIE